MYKICVSGREHIKVKGIWLSSVKSLSLFLLSTLPFFSSLKEFLTKTFLLFIQYLNHFFIHLILYLFSSLTLLLYIN